MYIYILLNKNLNISSYLLLFLNEVDTTKNITFIVLSGSQIKAETVVTANDFRNIQ